MGQRMSPLWVRWQQHQQLLTLLLLRHKQGTASKSRNSAQPYLNRAHAALVSWAVRAVAGCCWPRPRQLRQLWSATEAWVGALRAGEAVMQAGRPSRPPSAPATQVRPSGGFRSQAVHRMPLCGSAKGCTAPSGESQGSCQRPHCAERAQVQHTWRSWRAAAPELLILACRRRKLGGWAVCVAELGAGTVWGAAPAPCLTFVSSECCLPACVLR
jgi:hypothetical protein